METLSTKVVKIRKARYCFGCCRKFEKGSQMECQVNVDGGDIGSIYSCLTCVKLYVKFQDWCFDMGESTEGCIVELLRETEYQGKTPEQLLNPQ